MKKNKEQAKIKEGAVLSDKKQNFDKDGLEALDKQLEDMKNDYLRLRADFDNYRKRKEIEIAQARERGVRDFVLDLLPAIDNFELSLKMTDNKEMFIKGVEMIHGNLLETLKLHNFEPFEPKPDELFDPYYHDPLLIEDHSLEPGKVISVLSKGYKHKGEVIKPARVQVAKEKEDKEAE